MRSTDSQKRIDRDDFEPLKARIRCGQPLYPWTSLTERNVELACRDALRGHLQLPRRPGIDYGLLGCGLRYALAILNRRITRFPAFAAEVIENLGDAAIPYLRSWYAAKWDPRFIGGTVESDASADACVRSRGWIGVRSAQPIAGRRQ